MSEIHSKISLHRFSLFSLSIDKNHLIADEFYPFRFCIHWLLQDVTTPGTTPTYFERAAGLNRDNPDTYKPEEDFNPLNPDIKIQILICYPYTFLIEVVGRIC